MQCTFYRCTARDLRQVLLIKKIISLKVITKQCQFSGDDICQLLHEAGHPNAPANVDIHGSENDDIGEVVKLLQRRRRRKVQKFCATVRVAIEADTIRAQM